MNKKKKKKRKLAAQKGRAANQSIITEVSVESPPPETSKKEEPPETPKPETFKKEEPPPKTHLSKSIMRYVATGALVIVIVLSAAFVIRDRYEFYQQKKTNEAVLKAYGEAKQAAELLATPTPYVTKAPVETPTPSEPASTLAPSTAAPTAAPTPPPTATPTETPEPTPRPIQQTFAQLRQTFGNDDIIGFLEIPGTTINYPVLWRWHEEYYLDHDVYGQASKAGSIYMDGWNYLDESGVMEKNTILYGHNMRDSIMFHDLRYFVDKSYYNKHKYVIFNTIYGDYVWEIFAFHRSFTSFDYIKINFADDDDFLELANEMKSRSLYDTGVEVSKDDYILTLSTCTNVEEDSRFAIEARLILEPENMPLFD